MKVLLTYVTAVLTIGTSLLAQETNTASSVLLTNLVEILPFAERFAKNLDLEIAEPLTTNIVMKFSPYRGVVRDVGISLSNGWSFAFNVKHHLITNFEDRKHSVANMTAEKMRTLRNVSTITPKQALEVARKYLAGLGYSETDSPVLAPRVTQSKWLKTGEESPLPFYIVEWPWRERPDAEYFSMEVDGIRQKINTFHTMRGTFAEESEKAFRMDSGKSSNSP